MSTILVRPELPGSTEPAESNHLSPYQFFNGYVPFTELLHWSYNSRSAVTMWLSTERAPMGLQFETVQLSWFMAEARSDSI
jgi:hypothetical protein